MGYSPPTPNYGLLANLPTPDPVGSALGAYQKMQENKRANQATALAQRLGDLQAQKAQQSITNEPIDEALKQHQLNLSNQASTLTLQSAKRNIHDKGLADIHQASDDQKDPQYQKYRKRMVSLGGDVSNLPLHYNDQVGLEAKNAFDKSPLAIEQRKNAQAILLEQMKEKSAMGVAVAKLKNAPAKETALQVAQSKQLVTDASTINTAANEAQTKAIPLWTEINRQLDKVSTGPGIGSIDIRSGAAQRLNQLLMQAQGLKIKSFHLGRMTQYEFNIIRKMVGTPTMYKAVLRKIVKQHLRDAQEAIEQQKFSSGYIRGGGISPTEMSNKWVKEIGKRRQADLEYTAKQNNMTVAQVKKQMGY